MVFIITFIVFTGVFLFWHYFHNVKRKQISSLNKKDLAKDYFTGLNYLLNEQDDKAVEIFIRLFEVDRDTVETHLALGSLFRKRGEVDRAIRIHQNLIARPQLSVSERFEGLLALGRDYLVAGVLDRAEKIFLEIVAARVEQKKQALFYLLDIYQREKLWLKAISIAKQIQDTTKQSMSSLIAHYYCEIGERNVIQNEIYQANKNIKMALKADSTSIRANLLKAKVAFLQNKYRDALIAYKKVVESDIVFLLEVFQGILACYKEMDKYDEGVDYLRELNKANPDTSIVLLLIDELSKKEFFQESYHDLFEQLRQKPSLSGLVKLISIYTEELNGDEQQKPIFNYLVEIGNQLLAKKTLYRCQNCGFASKHLLWYCPGCKRWDLIRPILTETT